MTTLAALSAFVRKLVVARGHLDRRRRIGSSVCDSAGRRTHGTTMAVDGALQSLAEVTQEMPAIGDLRRRRRSLPCPLRVGSGAISRDDLNARMSTQPGCDGLSAAVGQQVDDTSTLEVADDGSVALAASPSPIIDANHTGRSKRHQLGRADQPQQRIAADRHGEPNRKARPGLTAQREADLALNAA